MSSQSAQRSTQSLVHFTLWNCHNGLTVVRLTIRRMMIYNSNLRFLKCVSRVCRLCANASAKTWPTSGAS